MILKRVLLAAATFSLLIGCRAETQPSTSQPAAQQSAAGLELIPLRIRSGQQTHNFTVEVARTVEEQARGLMFRQSLAPTMGMLFPKSPPGPAHFWMKNTLIPLDMIFVRPDGSIARIAVNTIPHSEEPVGVEEPVAAVLELAGGRTVELGINEGDRVSWAGGPSL
jgi:hypothetical protein